MAVYTQVPVEALAEFLDRFDVGALQSAKGIAEGVENSNYLVDTDRARFILTLYEKRVAAGDLPFFVALLDHLARAGSPVPPMIASRDGTVIHELAGRPACLITFLSGVSISTPDPDACHAVGRALGAMHRAVADFAPERPNALGIDAWRPLAAACGDLDVIAPGLARLVADELDALEADWPRDLPRHVIHADLFPDNVLMLDGAITGLIDFYFACTDLSAYDLAVTHSAWCFDADGDRYHPDRGAALVAGYDSVRPLSDAERRALPLLARGASLRFMLTRAYDWVHTPPTALVTRKDPLAYARRLTHYRDHGADLFG